MGAHGESSSGDGGAAPRFGYPSARFPDFVMFNKILIANRGEIACRIARSCRRLGVATVAVYSSADRRAQHVLACDEAYAIGAAPPRESYLKAERIIDAAQRCGAEAIHPGYGFLSENAAFAAAVGRAGLVFIGPSPRAIEQMGDKRAAKALMERAGVPVVPGYHGADQGVAQLLDEAQRIGFPILIKASAGGGGKGMRRVDSAADFAAALASCQREAENAFGDATVLLERYVERPRHVEVQVFGDNFGAAVYLFERDCSVQRRHQKVLEEAPAPGLDTVQRQRMGEAAVAAARAIDYCGAGTIEFIRAPDGAFYFMEMNTRLQVEHPVTEMITGLDLVEWQLRVAAGEPLPLRQEQLVCRGHAIEARIYAEDPARGFLPQIGVLQHLKFPPPSAEVRVDAGVVASDEISPHYDPMIAKLIVHGADRQSALARLRDALARCEVAGIGNNVAFLFRVANCDAFSRGDIDTALIERENAVLFAPPRAALVEVLALAGLCYVSAVADAAHTAAAQSQDRFSPWFQADGWRLNEDNHVDFVLHLGGDKHAITLHYRPEGYEIECAGARLNLRGLYRDGVVEAELDGRRLRAGAAASTRQVSLWYAGEQFEVLVDDPLAQAEVDSAGAGGFRAPMPGKVAAVLVQTGQTVDAGDALVVLEAMKMEHTIAAPRRGRVAELFCRAGDQVAEGAELLAFAVEAET
jgi:3-methylcrotonyl-CoA carboxylase alpha subunit